MLRFLGKLEEILLQDPGSRGVAALACPGHLQKASRLFWQSPSVLILTGFPCCLEHTPPTEVGAICEIQQHRGLSSTRITFFPE